MKELETFAGFIEYDHPYVSRKEESMAGILSCIRSKVDTFRHFMSHQSFSGRDYSTIEALWQQNSRRRFHLFSPTFTPEQIEAGLIQVWTVNKNNVRTGKTAVMKVGKFLTQAFPFLDDATKEAIVVELKNEYAPLDVDYDIVTTGFGDIVTMRPAKSTYLSTTCTKKSLSDSCMRYTKVDLGFDKYHPYDAYCSGEFGLAYLHKDGKMYARSLVHFPTNSFGPIYTVSDKAYIHLEQILDKAGYTSVGSSHFDDKHPWTGAKLLYLEDTFYNEDENEEIEVIITPYVDLVDDDTGYTNRKDYIYINHKEPGYHWEVDIQFASGYNEV